MKKNNFIKFIEKFHLDGLTEEAKVISNDGNLMSRVLTKNMDIASVTYNAYDGPELKLGLRNCNDLLKRLSGSLLESDIDLTVILNEEEIPCGLKFSNQSDETEINFYCASIESFKKVPVMPERKYEFQMEITPKFKSFVSGVKNATSFDAFSFIKKKGRIFIVFGNPESENDNIIFDTGKEYSGNWNIQKFKFDSLLSILNNNKDAEESYLSVSLIGMCRYDFNTAEFKSSYISIKTAN